MIGESRRLRPLVADDEASVEQVLALNERWVPHVGALTRDRLVRILDEAAYAVVAERTAVPGPDGALGRAGLDGFVIVLGPGADYDSPNYRYFVDRAAAGDPTASSERFTYVDRIAVSPEAQGRGIGRALYEAVVDHARSSGADEVTCEVNLEPPNPDSLAFHRRLGFVEVGTQWTYDHTVRVQLLARPL